MSTAKELKEAIEVAWRALNTYHTAGSPLSIAECVRAQEILRAHLATIDEERALLEAAEKRCRLRAELADFVDPTSRVAEYSDLVYRHEMAERVERELYRALVAKREQR